MPNLSSPSGLNPVNTQLLHCPSKCVEETLLITRVELHKRPSPVVLEQRAIRFQDPQPLRQVLEVDIVELVGGHDVIEDGKCRILPVIGAGPLQPGGESRVVLGVVLLRLTVVVDPGAYLVAVGESNGVGPTESDHFLDGKAPGPEHLDELGHRHGGLGEAAFDGGGFGYAAVFAAEWDVVVGPAHHGDEITSGDGEDVGAGDGAGAGELEGGFCANDDVEGVAGEGVVDVGVALGFVEGSRGDEDGGVAAVVEAVVEEEAEGCGGGGGAGDLLVGDGVLDDLGESRTRFPVVVGVESRLGGGESGGES